MKEYIYELDMKVRDYECDIQGVVNNSVYQNYLEHTRHEFMLKKGIEAKQAKVLVLGITFKENCPDIRNSRAIDVVRELQDYQMQVDVYDPWASVEEVKDEYGLDLITDINASDEKYDAVLAVVAHNEFKNMDLSKYTIENALIYDVKAIFPKDKSDLRL